MHFTGTADQALSTRVGTVRREVLRRLRRQAPRVAGLATDSLPDAAVPVRGLAVYFVDFASLVVSTRFCYWGQRRMRDDRRAPSRSYLKVEEAYAVLGEAPSRGQRVADLGAAPGGWSYSAAERGAEVIAVDNGPLKGGALGHPRITHVRADAFRFRADRPFDWLFCDLIESPERVLREILVRWLEQRLCRAFIVNLKVGKADPLRLLRELRSDRSDGLVGLCERLCIRQLYHDRDEITCMGIALSGR